MAFVHKDEVVSLESFDRDRLIAHLVGELVDVDDFEGALEGAGFVFLEVADEAETGELGLAQVLGGQTLVGCEQDDLIREHAFTPRLVVVQVLEDVDVEEERLAAARGVPKSEAVEIVGGEGRETHLGLVGVKSNERGVEAVEELRTAAEIPIEVDLGEEEREVLEILELKDVTLALVAGGGDGLPMANDGEIVAAQLWLGDTVDVEQVGGELVKKQRLPVLVQAFPAILAEALF